MQKFVMVQEDGTAGLKAQGGVLGIRKRSPKKGWVFFSFVAVRHATAETVTDEETLRTLKGWVEGIFFSDVQIHDTGVFSGKTHMAESEIPWMQEVVSPASVPFVSTKNLPETIPAPSDGAKGQTLGELVIALAVEAVDGVFPAPKVRVSAREYLHSTRVPRPINVMLWSEKSDNARKKIWKRYHRRDTGGLSSLFLGVPKADFRIKQDDPRAMKVAQRAAIYAELKGSWASSGGGV